MRCSADCVIYACFANKDFSMIALYLSSISGGFEIPRDTIVPSYVRTFANVRILALYRLIIFIERNFGFSIAVLVV